MKIGCSLQSMNSHSSLFPPPFLVRFWLDKFVFNGFAIFMNFDFFFGLDKFDEVMSVNRKMKVRKMNEK